MRYAIAGTMLALALLTASVDAAAQGIEEGKRDILEILFDRNPQRSLDSGTFVCGSLIKGRKWYVLSASEIRAVCKILGQKRRVFEGGGSIPQSPVPIYTIVLWGAAREGLGPVKVLSLDRSVRVLTSLDEAGWYVPGGDERECLQKLTRRIEEGKEQAIVHKALGTKSQADGKALHEDDP